MVSAVAAFVLLAAPLGICPPLLAAEPGSTIRDYDQWKEALTKGEATGVSSISALPGFRVDRLRSALPEEGSWVSMVTDSQQRMLIAREKRGILRLTPPEGPQDPVRVEVVNDTLLECRGMLFIERDLYVNANNSKGFYRLRDTTGDEQFDEVKLLRATPGGVGHGRNDLTLGPDGHIYLIHGNDTRLPEDFQTGRSPFRNYALDRLLPCEWNARLFNAGVKPPAGHVIRTDREGKTWELVAGGFRNPFGIDFNSDGEMFTFDADMEWDAGAPWYRPCRVNHIVSGADYGWRQGTGKWPAYYPDSLPAVLDIGLASPTAVKFGTRSNFPAKYRRALFILDWAYGRIIAVHLTPQGASYTARAETFVKGRPLNVTDVDFGPDGAMYFITGGRGTQAGLYRVKYVGPKNKSGSQTSDKAPSDDQAAAARALRRNLEAFHGSLHAGAIAQAWPHLDSPDRWIRHAARVAIEHQPAESWQARALQETRPLAKAAALLALARVAEKPHQPQLLDALCRLPFKELSVDAKRTAVRALAVCFARQGRPSAEVIHRLTEKLEGIYPDKDVPVNQMLCELLVYLDARCVVERTLPLLADAQSREEKLHYLFTLRHVRSHWTPAQRRTYFFWLRQAADFEGARYMPTFVRSIKQDAMATLSESEKQRLGALLDDPKPDAEEPQPLVSDRKLVRKWKLDDLEGSLAAEQEERNLDRGKSMFAAALCSRCHRFGTSGKAVGPDLTAVVRRFSRRDLLESILAPSKTVGEKYRNTMIATDDGKVVIGSLVGGDEQSLLLATDPLALDKVIRIEKASIEAQQFSLVSPMPPGLLDTLTKGEILDLLAYIESASEAEPLDLGTEKQAGQ